jgi:O-Antigen ligase
VAVGVVVAVIAIVLAHPVRRLEAFKEPPVAFDSSSGVERHLISGGGNGRWQLWHAAWKEFESKPLQGQGAGSYDAWWAQHGTISGVVKDAHSLYLETLGELGVVGFSLLVLIFGAGFVVAARRLRAASGDMRVSLAAATASFFAFALAAAVDWMWELTIVSFVAFVCLGLIVGPATAAVPPRAVEPGERPRSSRAGRYAAGVAVVVGGLLIVCAIAVPLLSGVKMRASQDAFAAGNAQRAVRAALDARDIEPWSAVPYLQVALIEEQAGDYATAKRWIADALSRAPNDWHLWLTQARIETELGHLRAADQSLHRARELSPRAAIWQGS